MNAPHAGRGGRPKSGIIHFPIAHRRDLIAKIAVRMAAAPLRHAEKQFRMALQRQVDGLQRKNVSHNVVEKQVHALESEIRAEPLAAYACAVEVNRCGMTISRHG